MNLRNLVAVSLAMKCWIFAACAYAQQSNTVVTITGLQESNVVTRIDRFDPATKQTNVLTKTKFYQNGFLVMDKAHLNGPVLLTTARVYHEGQLVMHEAWDSKSEVAQRTFLRDGKAVVSEISSKSGKAPNLILFHGKNEEIVAALKRDESGELKMVDAVALAEIQRGSKAGTEFMNELSREAGAKNPPK